MSADDPDMGICRHCGARSDWHDACNGACPDNDGPHPDSIAGQFAAAMREIWEREIAA